MVRMGIVLLAMAINGASPCLAAGLSSGVVVGACYVSSIDRDLRYCRDSVAEKVCYQAAGAFKMAGRWVDGESCVDINYK